MSVPATGTCIYLTYILRCSSRSVWRNESRNLELVRIFARPCGMSVRNTATVVESSPLIQQRKYERNSFIRTHTYIWPFYFSSEKIISNFYPTPITCWQITWQRAWKLLGNWKCGVNRFNERRNTFEYSLRLFIFRLFLQFLRPCYQSKLTWSETFKNDDVLNSAEGI